MASQTRLETSSTITPPLTWCILRGWSIRAGAAHWVEVRAAEASASRSSGVVLESSVAVPGTEGMTLAWASAVGSFVVV
jgi:hypothetical protein